MEPTNDQPVSDKRDEQSERILTSLMRNKEELDHLRYVILQRRLLEVRVGILIIVATLLFVTFLLWYSVLWSERGFIPASVAQWIMIALMVLFFVSAWKGATIMMNIEGRTKLYEDALDEHRKRAVNAQTETTAASPEKPNAEAGSQ
jgi:hypothetical protein